MKNFLIKTLNIILTIIMILSALYAVFNLVMTFLPAEIQSQVYEWLNMSQEYITTFSISSVFNATVLVGSKLLQTYTKIKTTEQLSKSEQLISQDMAVNQIVIDRINAVVNNMTVLQQINDAILAVQKVTAQRNINASDMLVSQTEKEEYQAALDQIEKAKQKLLEVNNVSTVYEKTEIKEVVVEKPADNDLAGRV